MSIRGSKIGCRDVHGDETQEINDLITPEKVREYLTNRVKPMRCRNAKQCPIASVLRSDERYSDVNFDPHAKRGSAPPWAIRFGKLVDEESTDEITPQRALVLLDQVLKEEKS